MMLKKNTINDILFILITVAIFGCGIYIYTQQEIKHALKEQESKQKIDSLTFDNLALDRNIQFYEQKIVSLNDTLEILNRKQDEAEAKAIKTPNTENYKQAYYRCKEARVIDNRRVKQLNLKTNTVLDKASNLEEIIAINEEYKKRCKTDPKKVGGAFLLGLIIGLAIP